ncbi:hypothetical protein AAHA92_12138 [Salvia divinorum]|uniref:Uncharacterized protein n=1 Tax=Salvia divinorum TaxID=28513 RepID=A0ABD1HK16_SALDI
MHTYGTHLPFLTISLLLPQIPNSRHNKIKSLNQKFYTTTPVSLAFSLELTNQFCGRARSRQHSRCRPAPTSGAHLPVVAASANVVWRPPYSDRGPQRGVLQSRSRPGPHLRRISHRVAVPNRSW